MKPKHRKRTSKRQANRTPARIPKINHNALFERCPNRFSIQRASIGNGELPELSALALDEGYEFYKDPAVLLASFSFQDCG